jgi:hypothetical protein
VLNREEARRLAEIERHAVVEGPQWAGRISERRVPS